MNLWLWGGFLLLVLALLALDLGVFHRKPKAIAFREAMGWSAFWIGLGVAFTAFVYFGYENRWLGLGEHASGGTAALEYIGGYLIEKSLSVDNIFVIAIIFRQFSIPDMHQHRVLFWGILGALVFRGIMIALGVEALNRFDWMMYVFGGLLLLSAYKMARSADSPPDPKNSVLVRWVSRVVPIATELHGSKMVVRIDGRLMITRLALVLLVIEVSDVFFAIDSIPAVFAVTRDPFLVFTSNVFAILGLRSLYFALSGLIDRFHYLELALVAVLAFVGIKMLLLEVFHIPTWISLLIILAILSAGAVLSVVRKPPENPEIPPPPPVDG